MSSTQHQLIEQCATRLRGIVEALDNIHDNTPHRWSTDLDDVHSSAESLLALIKDQAPTQAAQGLAGAALAQPSPKREQRLVECDACPTSGGCVEKCMKAPTQPSPAQTQPSPAPTLRVAIDVANARFEVPVAKWGTNLVGEEEQPEVVAYFDRNYPSTGDAFIWSNYEGSPYEPVMTVAQHERIVKAWIERWKAYIELSAKIAAQRDAAQAEVEALRAELQSQRERNTELIFKLGSATNGWGRCEKERDAALARVAEFEVQAQHSVPESVRAWFEAKQAHVNAVDAYNARLKFVREHCPFGTSVDPEYQLMEEADRLARGLVGPMFDELRSLLAAAPGKEVPQAWLDVQAERRRQVEAEGWTPEHDDEHSHGQMARAAACYALAGSSAPNDGTAALLVSLAWPWDQQWWKPSTPRRDLVKACALALAEIERLDRACISQSPQPGATTASS
ncbi:hypothetical protein ACOJK1_003470 [Pseudomonas aeruginosa]